MVGMRVMKCRHVARRVAAHARAVAVDATCDVARGRHAQGVVRDERSRDRRARREPAKGVARARVIFILHGQSLVERVGAGRVGAARSHLLPPAVDVLRAVRAGDDDAGDADARGAIGDVRANADARRLRRRREHGVPRARVRDRKREESERERIVVRDAHARDEGEDETAVGGDGRTGARGVDAGGARGVGEDPGSRRARANARVRVGHGWISRVDAGEATSAVARGEGGGGG